MSSQVFAPRCPSAWLIPLSQRIGLLALTIPGALAATNAGPSLPHGLRGAVEIPDPGRWWRLAAVLAFVAVLCGVGFWLWWRRRGMKLESSAEHPDDLARRRLQRALELLEQPKVFVAEVSEAVRAYLEARFGLRAPERTTEEFIGELQASGTLAVADRDALEKFLGACDLVKFAGVRPGRSDLEELHVAALRLVNELTTAARPASDVAAAGGGEVAPGDPPRLPPGGPT